MDPSRRDELQGGPGPAEHIIDERDQQRQPAQSQYGSAPLPPHTQQQQPTLPPPSSFYPPPTSLPPLGSLHPSPSAPPRQPHEMAHDQRPPNPSGPQSFSLPSIHQPGQVMDQQAEYEREREQEARDRDLRAREFDDRARQEQHERERRDWEMQQRQDREQPLQHQGHAEAPQIHQPVAVAPPGATPVHGPNGILAGAAGPQGNPPQYPLVPPQPIGTPGAPVPMFGPHIETTPRSGPHPSHLPQNAAQFQGTPQMQGQPAGPGQQPILNDALSYLDQVKVQFHGQSEVYNQFLDIMKDFKSQAIDTPGVINRVSLLFAGNSQLIQGFNTFLPQGYRIECQADGNPEGIRVLTPQGTYIDTHGHQLHVPPGHGRIQDGMPPSYDGHDRGQGDAALYSPNLRPEHARGHRHLSPFEGNVQRDNHNAEVDAALIAHQQNHRGVTQLQNAANAADNGHMPLQQSVSPSLQAGAALPNGLGLTQGQTRGPVEFNHAISYVNKIKNRFTGQPEIYKNFLEILQTYQRESRPIQDVYSQVTSLFHEAPDLLRDFKQFLPETSAHAKQETARHVAEEYQNSNVRGEPTERPARQTPKPDQSRLPPLGNFQPTPTANRDVKRKRGERGGPVPPPDFGPSRSGYAPSKRAKQSQPQPPPPPPKQQAPMDTPAIEPNLIPELPQPMEPNTTTAASSEELQFFDRVKKHLGNKSTMNDWLKLCNLFAQDLIDKNTLVYRAADFIGDNTELFTYLKTFLGYTGENQIVENRARPDSGRVSLNNCRGYGPSYRLLPKRDRQATCSGRDELCNAVLNDAWASHPTWASEDSGFIAHRKNAHEEGLHRIEEERHDYDHHISVCERAIQILDPIAQQIANTSRDQLTQMRLGQEFTITNHFVFKTSLSKIYGREPATSIIESLPERPASVVPVILLRMRQKLEEWKMVQREWEKVWRDQTQKMFWKSLDHQGIAVKAQDKRQFQTKTLQNEIHVKFVEQQKSRDKHVGRVPYQMKFDFKDKDVLFDASYLLLTYAEHAYTLDSPKIQAFIKDFVPLFFDLDAEAFKQRMQEVNEATTPNEEMEEETAASETSTQPRNTRKANGKKSDLLRDVLDKSRKTGRGDRESSIASGSRASTPDVISTVEEDAAEAAEAAEVEEKHKRWFDHPVVGNMHNRVDLKPNDPFMRNVYNLYANLNIYCFFKVFVMLYERLVAIKQCEKDIHDAIARERKHKPAEDFAIIDRKPTDFFRDVSPGANYYQQILDMLEEVSKSSPEITMGQVEEVLRRYYLQKGYQLYTFEKMMGALTRFATATLSTTDVKERSHDIMTLFFKDRKKEWTTHQDEVTYRKQVEKYVKEGDIYKIRYYAPGFTASVHVMRREENTFDMHGPEFSHVDGTLTLEDRWRLYITLYSSLEATEGVNPSAMRKVFLDRSVRTVKQRIEHAIEKLKEARPEAEAVLPPKTQLEWRIGQLNSIENLKLRISPSTYAIVWGDDDGEEQWVSRPFLRALGRRKEPGSSTTRQDGAQDDDPEVKKDEDGDHHEGDAEARFLEKFVMNNAWMADRSREEVDQRKKEWVAFIEGDADVSMVEG